MSPLGSWTPNRFERFEQSFDTSLGTSIVVTDAGKAYLKPLGNRQGPHVLACEWVATQLADWFGLTTFEYALLTITADDEIPLARGKLATAGPAFVSKAENGYTWGGDVESLTRLVNLADVSRLVVFDTWTRNCDRHPPTSARKMNLDNVFISMTGLPSGRSKLIAMDHTHCFTCGRDLDEGIANIDNVQDSKIYGLFPAFKLVMDKAAVESACAQLRTLDHGVAATIVASIPPEWEVAANARDSLVSFIVQRAPFVADNIVTGLTPLCWPPKAQNLFKEQES